MGDTSAELRYARSLTMLLQAILRHERALRGQGVASVSREELASAEEHFAEMLGSLAE